MKAKTKNTENGFVISSELTLPIEAVTQTFAFLAKRGVGKTYAGMKLCEEILKAGHQVVAVDPVGVWWGLRSSADGKREGLPIIVFGGEHGDVELQSTSGSKVAELVVKQRLSVILDLCLFRKNESVRFMTAFCETLYRKKAVREFQNPLQLMLDEADAFAPQRPFKDEARMLGAVEDLVRRGRARGIGVSLITQRAAVLNKNVLTQIETLLAFRTLSPQDRAAVKAWVEAHDVHGQLKEFMDTLATLEVGQAWVWSPGWLDIFKLIKIAKRETFDSSSTPKVGQKLAKPKKFAQVDLAAIQDFISPPKPEPTKKTKSPKVVKEVVEVEKIVEVQIFREGEVDALVEMGENLQKQLKAAIDAVRASQVLKPRVAQNQVSKRKPISPSNPTKQKGNNLDGVSANTIPAALCLSSPQQRILIALASLENLGLGSVSRSNVAVFSDQSPRSSGYSNNVSRLSAEGLLSYPQPGQLALTGLGREVTNGQAEHYDQAGLHQAWFSKIPNPQATILGVLISLYPESISRDDLAEQSGQSPASSGYSNNISRLSSLGLAYYPQPGWVAATDLLFPEGL